MTQQQRAFERGPYLTAALLCERVLSEENGVKSLIRIIDRITLQAVGPTPPEQIVPIQADLMLFVSFKAGIQRGPMPLVIRIDKPPTANIPPPLRRTLNFEGDDDRGLNVIVSLRGLSLDVAGLWWFHIELDKVRVTSIPLRVIYLPQPTPDPATGGANPQ